jgi:hypothetical protein
MGVLDVAVSVVISRLDPFTLSLIPVRLSSMHFYTRSLRSLMYFLPDVY